MKHIDFYLDFISPYAYLAFQQLPKALLGLSYSVRYHPILFGALLHHHGQLGPAEIEAKRSWTYRQVSWLSHHHQLPMQMPSVHPFNPLPLLRLAVSSSMQGEPNRFVCETIFEHVWLGGQDPLDEIRLGLLDHKLSSFKALSPEVTRTMLKNKTDEAIAQGVFGVPAFVVDDKLFWGFDALPMLRSYLQGDAWFAGPSWQAASQIPAGIQRKR
jgi:2-hydroxychromene-2-carboxylate isomerase